MIADGANDNFAQCDPQALISQIGRGQLAAISGGRVLTRATGVTLPVGSGYEVTIDLAADDTYTVRRVRVQDREARILGERTGVYCDEAGEAAYRASCFENVAF